MSTAGRSTSTESKLILHRDSLIIRIKIRISYPMRRPWAARWINHLSLWHHRLILYEFIKEFNKRHMSSSFAHLGSSLFYPAGANYFGIWDLLGPVYLVLKLRSMLLLPDTKSGTLSEAAVRPSVCLSVYLSGCLFLFHAPRLKKVHFRVMVTVDH